MPVQAPDTWVSSTLQAGTQHLAKPNAHATMTRQRAMLCQLNAVHSIAGQTINELVTISGRGNLLYAWAQAVWLHNLTPQLWHCIASG